MSRLLARVAVAVALVPVLAAPASAGSERMQLTCGDGRVIERSNGSSWWGVDHQGAYVTRHLRITAEGQVQYEKSYGVKGGGAASTCVAAHFGSTWEVELVRTR